MYTVVLIRDEADCGFVAFVDAHTPLEAARAAFSAGLLPMTDVLDDLGRLVSDRRAAVDLEARRILAIAELEAATGSRLLETGGGR